MSIFLCKNTSVKKQQQHETNIPMYRISLSIYFPPFLRFNCFLVFFYDNKKKKIIEIYRKKSLKSFLEYRMRYGMKDLNRKTIAKSKV